MKNAFCFSEVPGIPEEIKPYALGVFCVVSHVHVCAIEHTAMCI